MKNNSLLLALFFMAVWCAPPAPAAETLRFRSKYYHITTDLPREIAAEVAEHMDVVFAEYSKRFSNFRPKTPGQQPLYVFASQRDYLDLLRKNGANGSGTGGMFFSNNNASGLATFLETQGLEQMFHTLRHEGFHQFAFNRIGTGLPVWVNEGLADYFGVSIVADGKLHAGLVPYQLLRSLRQAIEADKHIPFRQLLTMTNGEWNQRVNRGDSGLQYVQSWSIVHFLIHGGEKKDKYAERFEAYLHLVAEGVESGTAFGRTFGANSYDSFERAWRKYIMELEPSPEPTAALRLHFLGMGMEQLDKRGEKVESLDKLKTRLQQLRFVVSHTLGPGVQFQINSADDDNFLPPPVVKKSTTGKAAETSIELIPSDKPDTPPEIVVSGLAYPVRLTWRTGPTGPPLSRIVYDKPSKPATTKKRP